MFLGWYNGRLMWKSPEFTTLKEARDHARELWKNGYHNFEYVPRKGKIYVLYR